MPFTGAHPLAITPLLRIRSLDATALVIGSMAPDFEYFAHGEEAGSFGHTLLGLVLWCLPVTAALGLAWHHVVKWPLIVASPDPIARRVARQAPWKPGPLAIVGALIGAASHDVWDAFTHADGFVVRRWDDLRAPVDVPILGHTVVHRVLQHGFSIVAFPIVLALIARAIYRRAPVELPPRAAWKARLVLVGLGGVGIAATVCRAVYLRHVHDAGDVIVAIIAGGLAGTTLASLILRRDALVVRSVSGHRDT